LVDGGAAWIWEGSEYKLHSLRPRIDDVDIRVCQFSTGGRSCAPMAAAVAGAVEIEGNERTPVEFRRELVAALTRDALDQALERAR